MSYKVAAILAMVFATTPAYADNEDCSECHEIELSRVAETVHGFLECTDCHPGGPQIPHGPFPIGAKCADCHGDLVNEYTASVHGGVGPDSESLADGCAACHGEIHALKPGDSPASHIHPVRIAETCGLCHADPGAAERFSVLLVRPLEAYQASVHARAIKEGEQGASCASCHGSHGILPAAHPRSKVNRRRVPTTCGQCHRDIEVTYANSVHGRAAAHGITEAPVCSDCHSEHRILSPKQEGSPVFASNIPKMTCGRCHGDLHLNEKFGMPADRVPAYEDSYHGMAARAGATTVANCSSCHGIHDILPSTDPDSHTYSGNLSATCGKCHPGAGSRFALGPVHVLATEPEHAAIYYIRIFYVWLIVVTLGIMVLHNLLDFSRKFHDPPIRPRVQPWGHVDRMSKGFRIAHGLLAGSFVVLIYSGFALTYPESWWASSILQWESSFEVRGWIHRVAAVVLLAAGAFHLLHLAVDRPARACVAGMRPGLSDWIEFRERVAYFLGRRERAPESEWIGYPEKIEYLAALWGTAIMAATGLLLWFDNFFLHWLPKWTLDVATTIHFYEAVLASLAILVWHFYFVIFDPVVYPMDTAWLTGESPPRRAHERHPPRPRLPIRGKTPSWGR